MARGDAITIGGEDLTEEEVEVIGQALQDLLERLESDGACLECGSDEDEDGNSTHTVNCSAAIAHSIRQKLGVEVEGD
jgi:hypothetical protein